MATPYEEGFRDFLAGKTVYQNPYATFTKDHSSWEDGWQEHARHQAAKDEALDSLGWFG